MADSIEVKKYFCRRRRSLSMKSFKWKKFLNALVLLLLLLLVLPIQKMGVPPFNNSMLTMHCDDAKKECLNGNRKTSTLRLAMPSYNHAMLQSCKKSIIVGPSYIIYLLACFPNPEWWVHTYIHSRNSLKYSYLPSSSNGCWFTILLKSGWLLWVCISRQEGIHLFLANISSIIAIVC